MKPKKDVKSKPPIPSDLEEFQATYGADWIQITRSPAFIAAAQLLNIRKLRNITNLSNDQIEQNGREILSDLRGHLKHEEDLFTLQDQRDQRTPVDDEGRYVSPEEAIEIDAQIERFREQRKREHYAPTS